MRGGAQRGKIALPLRARNSAAGLGRKRRTYGCSFGHGSREVGGDRHPTEGGVARGERRHKGPGLWDCPQRQPSGLNEASMTSEPDVCRRSVFGRCDGCPTCRGKLGWRRRSVCRICSTRLAVRSTHAIGPQLLPRTRQPEFQSRFGELPYDARSSVPVRLDSVLRSPYSVPVEAGPPPTAFRDSYS
jgi:hypothetical protein